MSEVRHAFALFVADPCLPQTASSKADAVIADNPGQTLDDLVAAKKLNADQKAQVLKKPALQLQLAQYEEQVTQVRKIEKDCEERFLSERKDLQDHHQRDLLVARQEAATLARKTHAENLDQNLLTLSRFLHAAAAKRASEDSDSPEAKAFEGALLSVYQGNTTSVTTLKSLIEGMQESVTSTDGETLEYTFAQIKQSAIGSAPPLEEPTEEETTVVHAFDQPDSPSAPATDPTVAHAGLTEIEDTLSMPIGTNGVAYSDTMQMPEQASVTAEAANAVAESSWDPQASAMTSDSGNAEGWVEVPRDPAETDTGLTATPAAQHNSSNWADEVAEGNPANQGKIGGEGDGFEQVVHQHRERGGRVRGGRGGEFRGRGRGEGLRGGRGRGDRVDGGERRGGRARGRGEGPARGGNRGARSGNVLQPS